MQIYDFCGIVTIIKLIFYIKKPRADEKRLCSSLPLDMIYLLRLFCVYNLDVLDAELRAAARSACEDVGIDEGVARNGYCSRRVANESSVAMLRPT